MFRRRIKLYHCHNFRVAVQKLRTSMHDPVAAIAWNMDLLAFSHPRAIGAVVIVQVEMKGAVWSKEFRVHDDPVAYLALSEDGTLLAATSVKGTVVRVFDVRSGKKLRDLRRGTTSRKVLSIAFSSDKAYVAALSDGGTLHLFGLEGAARPNVTSKFKGLRAFSEYFSSEWALGKHRGIEAPMECSFVIETDVLFAREKRRVMVVTRRGEWLLLTFDLGVSEASRLKRAGKRRKRKKIKGYAPVEITVVSRFVHDYVRPPPVRGSKDFKIVANHRQRIDSHEFQVICRPKIIIVEGELDGPLEHLRPAPQISPERVIINRSTGQSVRFLLDIIRIRLEDIRRHKMEEIEGRRKSEKIEKAPSGKRKLFVFVDDEVRDEDELLFCLLQTQAATLKRLRRREEEEEGETSKKPVSRQELLQRERRKLQKQLLALAGPRILVIEYAYEFRPEHYALVRSGLEMPFRLSRHSVVRLDRTHALLFGGVSVSRGKIELSEELRDVEWTSVGEEDVIDVRTVELGLYGMSTPGLSSHASVYNPTDRCMYVFGGASGKEFSGALFWYSLLDKKWEDLRPMSPPEEGGTSPAPDEDEDDGCPRARIDCSMVLRAPPSSAEKRWLVVWGGFVGGMRNGEYSNLMHLYDLDHRTWKTVTPNSRNAPLGRCRHFASLYDNDTRMLMHGGVHDLTPCLDTCSYRFERNAWTRLSIFSPIESFCAAVMANSDHLVVISSDASQAAAFHIHKRRWTRIVVLHELRRPRLSPLSSASVARVSHEDLLAVDRLPRIAKCGVLYDDRTRVVYVFGGESPDRRSVSRILQIDLNLCPFFKPKRGVE